MDPTRFDRVIRDWTDRAATRPSRRGLLALLSAALLGAEVISPPEADARRPGGRPGGGRRPGGHRHGGRRGGGRRPGGGGGGGCTPSCTGLQCGSDGCGGSCGSCPAGQTCQGGTCIGGGGCTPECTDKECGSDGCGGSCGSCADGQTCQGGTCVGGGGNACDGVDCPANYICEGGNCVPAPDRCGGPTGICNADPTPCGTSATGETCGCERTVEDNNVCVNAGDNVCTGVECTSTQDCEDALGFHFFCQEAKTNAQGQFCGCGFGTATGRVCVPECDNPNVAFAQARSHYGQGRRRNKR